MVGTSVMKLLSILVSTSASISISAFALVRSIRTKRLLNNQINIRSLILRELFQMINCKIDKGIITLKKF